MKVIRAKRVLHVPVNPEQPDHNVMRPVHTGLLAIVPTNFRAPPDSYDVVQKLNIQNPKGNKLNK